VISCSVVADTTVSEDAVPSSPKDGGVTIWKILTHYVSCYENSFQPHVEYLYVGKMYIH
jgi:hypothetical protein